MGYVVSSRQISSYVGSESMLTQVLSRPMQETYTGIKSDYKLKHHVDK